MKQFGRQCRLTVQQSQQAQEAAAAQAALNATEEDSSGPATRLAVDLSAMKIVFHINQATIDNPQFAEIYVYNLSEDTMNKIDNNGSSGNGQTVILEVGYGEDIATLFKGQAFQFRRGRENQTDTWFCILAQAGNQALSTAVVNVTHPAGTTQKQIRDHIKDEFKKCGVDSGYMCDVSEQGLPRSKSVMSSLADYLKQFCNTNNTDAVIEDDTIKMIPRGGNNGEPAFVLTTKTGLIGRPQLTTDGLNVTCLINPRLKWGGQIQVDPKSIQVPLYDIGYQGQYVDQTQKTLATAAGEQGRYNIISVSHHGDTRGDDWYTDIIAVGVGAQVQISGTSIRAVNNGS